MRSAGQPKRMNIRKRTRQVRSKLDPGAEAWLQRTWHHTEIPYVKKQGRKTPFSQSFDPLGFAETCNLHLCPSCPPCRVNPMALQLCMFASSILINRHGKESDDHDDDNNNHHNQNNQKNKVHTKTAAPSTIMYAFCRYIR